MGMREKPNGWSGRPEILAKLLAYEKSMCFDKDLEDDPPTKPLHTGDISYRYEGIGWKLGTELANWAAKTYFDRLIRKGQLVIEGVEGLEKYRALKAGAILTCNHFHPYDNYAVYKVLEGDLRREKKRLWKVIREGNYTSFPGLYGYFFRHCNTIPLAADRDVMKQFLRGVDALLRRGEKILIYPEQAMWWNYRKPRPLKPGAFLLAVRAGVPVQPVFITLRDTDTLDGYGNAVQAVTLHFLDTVYPDPALSEKANIRQLSAAVYAAMKAEYEAVYRRPLEYGEDL